MQEDLERDVFILDVQDITALGQPCFNSEVPLSSAEDIVVRAEGRRIANAGRDLSEIPASAAREAVRLDQANTERVLHALIGIAAPHMPDVSADVEAYLRRNE